MNTCLDGYYKNRHSCFLLQYHLVLATKYRKPVICGKLAKELERYFWQYFKDRDLEIQAMECMPDHVHILFDKRTGSLLLEALFLESELFYRERQ